MKNRKGYAVSFKRIILQPHYFSSSYVSNMTTPSNLNERTRKIMWAYYEKRALQALSDGFYFIQNDLIL